MFEIIKEFFEEINIMEFVFGIIEMISAIFLMKTGTSGYEMFFMLCGYHFGKSFYYKE